MKNTGDIENMFVGDSSLLSFNGHMEKTRDRFTTEQIDSLRTEIDSIDKAIVSLLAERSDVVKQIHRLKRTENLQILDKKREEKIVSRLQALYPELNPSMIAEIYEVIFSAYR